MLSSTLPWPILWEDQDVLVINKPPGVVVNRGQTITGVTVQDWLKGYLDSTNSDVMPETWRNQVPANFSGEFGTPEAIFEERWGIVHRLDKDTSGALVLAKHPGALVSLLAQFKSRQVHKTYTCLVHGKVRVESDTITAPIGRASHSRLQFAVQPDGRPAETEYQVQQFFPHLQLEVIQKLPGVAGSNFKKKASLYQGFTLVNCWPKTGRTHQLRVHWAHLKHPLVGDQTYAGKKRQTLDPLWCPRQFLHASQVVFHHPRSGEAVAVTAPLWPDLDQVLELLSVD